jgi:hypothetical protein
MVDGVRAMADYYFPAFDFKAKFRGYSVFIRRGVTKIKI